tara:strand:- start:2271 stop:3545 length:1275 start_codon:yes stop_codon:yes gene_type:complete
MIENFFVCYSREDYEFVASFELELIRELNKHPNLEINLKIDKSSDVIRLGDRYQDKIKTAIESSSGSIIFVSKNSVTSNFINTIELPKILETKKDNPDYLILPIYIDDVNDFNKDIEDYQAFNSKDTTLRSMPGDFKSLTYKLYINSIIENYKEQIEVNKVLEIEKELAFSKVLERKRLKSVKNRKKILGFGLLILIASVINYFTTQGEDALSVTDQSTDSTILSSPVSLKDSCNNAINFYEDLESIYDEYHIGIYNNSINIYNNFIAVYNTEDYSLLNAEEQKELHNELRVSEFQTDLILIKEGLSRFESQGLGDVSPEHVELKRALLQAQNVSIDIMIAAVKHVELYIQMINIWEEYYEEWDKAVSQTEATSVEEKYLELDGQNTIALQENNETEDELVLLLDSTLDEVTTLYERFCVGESN